MLMNYKLSRFCSMETQNNQYFNSFIYENKTIITFNSITQLFTTSYQK